MPTGPLDPDTENISTPGAAMLPWRHVALVAAGGTIGTAARALIAATIPDPADYPLGIFLINVAGAFALGLVVQFLASRGPDEGHRRLTRLAVGTGLIGGFTTYSTVTVDLAQLTVSSPMMAAAYFAGTLVVGSAASYVGIIAGARLGRGAR
ncbi:CrcB family protein [Microbacterium sp. zg.B48]|uniref:fluoride efflux transporter FluC n=1 Tax=unclassified Microbacterium TaxID=2609290 RepID=UPI00214C9B18|nr:MULTISPECIES: CrcB family protein [unclassified Microbacterium]MCR2764822.1 CrcB family protein [Microbacterium sp. zg.B48]MCR2810041.1 CrcB family protein [Microbacterium sp. zg.B185]WIM20119.1 CrcB family protein [Microbacterium sp. zg-B185]